MPQHHLPASHPVRRRKRQAPDTRVDQTDLSRCFTGDLSDDLQGLLPRRLDAGSWRFALLVAGALALAIALAGAAQADPYDGLLRGLADGAACLAGYAALGSYLGLRHRRTARSD